MSAVIAIDGPAGAGKSTLARRLADHLGVQRLDTGAMYRAVAWAALERGVDLDDQRAVAALAAAIDIAVDTTVEVDGVDATAAIRSPEVDAAVSHVAANPAVRTEMVRRQRRWVMQRGGGVVEGRDIGTVVLPDADLKIYLTAAPEERAGRRAAERQDGRTVPDVAAQMARRDQLDSTRAVSPLPTAGQVAAGALVVDSTGRTADDVLQEVLGWLWTNG